MASFVTNKGKAHLLSSLRGVTQPTNYYVALLTNDVPPTVDSNLISDVDEIAATNGYTTGGTSLTKNATDFDVFTEDDTNNYALLQIKDIAFTATGGPLPATGSGARYAALTDDDGTVADREVYAIFDLGEDKALTDTQVLTIPDMEIRLT